MTKFRSTALITAIILLATPTLAGNFALGFSNYSFPTQPEVSQIDCKPSTFTVCEEN